MTGKTIAREFNKGVTSKSVTRSATNGEPIRVVTQNSRGIRVGIPVSRYDIQVEKLPTALQFFLHI